MYAEVERAGAQAAHEARRGGELEVAVVAIRPEARREIAGEGKLLARACPRCRERARC